MATLNGTNDALDPGNSSKNTLKLENVRIELAEVETYPMLTLIFLLDREERHSHSC